MSVTAQERREYALWAVLLGACWLPTVGYFFAQEDFSHMLRAHEAGWGAWLPAGPLARPLIYGGWLQLGRLLFGLHPVPWHLVNVAVHVANVLLLPWVLRRMGLGHPGAVLAQVAYASAPVHYNTIIWAHHIDPSVGTLLVLAVCYVMLGPAHRGRTPLALFWCACAFGSSEIAVAVAPIVVLLMWTQGASPSAALRRCAPIIGLTAAYVGWRLTGHGGTAEGEAHQQLYTLAFGMNVPANVGRFGLTLTGPAWLGWILVRGRAWILDGYWIGAGCITLLLALTGWRIRRGAADTAAPSGRSIVAAWGWIGAGLAPTVLLTSFLPYRGALASAGVALLFALCADAWGRRWRTRVAVGAACVALTCATIALMPRGDTLRIRDKQQIARQVIGDLRAYLAAHPETRAVHIPELIEPFGLGAAALYWGAGIQLFFPTVTWVPDRDAVTEPTVVFEVEAGHLRPAQIWRPDA